MRGLRSRYVSDGAVFCCCANKIFGKMVLFVKIFVAGSIACFQHGQHDLVWLW